MTRNGRRLLRQIAALERRVPVLGHPMHAIAQDGWTLVRLPVAILLILGGLLSILPFLGIWMLPLGLMLLAIDVPMLQRPVSRGVVRARRAASLRLRRLRRRSARRG